MSKKGLGKFLTAAGIGAAITALFTTEKGKEYQAKIVALCEDIKNKLKDVDLEDVKETINTKIEEIKAELKDLDKEKALDIAKTKAKVLENKAKDLAKYAKEKGTPVLEKAAANLKAETIKVTKKILKKLEEK